MLVCIAKKNSHEQQLIAWGVTTYIFYLGASKFRTQFFFFYKLQMNLQKKNELCVSIKEKKYASNINIYDYLKCNRPRVCARVFD